MAALRLWVIVCSVCMASPLLRAQLPTPADSLLTELSNHTNRDSFRVNILNELAYTYYLGDPKRALQFAYEARLIAEEINFQRGKAQAMRMTGLVFWGQANFSNAINQFLTALKIAEELGDEQAIADITGNIGLVYNGIGDFTQALSYHQQALQVQRKLGNRIRESVALNNIGDAYVGLKELSTALEYYELALKIREETRNYIGQATNIRNIGNAYEEMGEHEKALQYYFKSMALSDMHDDKRGMSRCRHSIASTYFKMKKFELARKFARESLAISKRFNHRAFIRDTYDLLYQIGAAQNNVKDAIDNLKLYAAYKDSVLNAQVASEIAALRLDYEEQRKQTEIDLLRKDAQLREQSLTQKNILLISISIVLILSILVIGTTFRNVQQQKHVNSTLKSSNEEINKRNEEIAKQRDALTALHQEVLIQRDTLVQKNEAIASMNSQILEVNENLERIVAERTVALEKQNQQLLEYTFINAHKLRAPLARVLGLTNLMALTSSAEEHRKLISHLADSANELDVVVRSVNEALQHGLDAYAPIVQQTEKTES